MLGFETVVGTVVPSERPQIILGCCPLLAGPSSTRQWPTAQYPLLLGQLTTSARQAVDVPRVNRFHHQVINLRQVCTHAHDLGGHVVAWLLCQLLRELVQLDLLEPFLCGFPAILHSLGLQFACVCGCDCHATP